MKTIKKTVGKTSRKAFLKLIQERHSCRIPFDLQKPVPKAKLDLILEAARWTPTAHNMQNFEIIVVDDKATIGKIGLIPSGITPEFIKENYRQMSFSQEEFLRKKTGVLAEMFPPSWRRPEAAEGRVAPEETRSHLWDMIHGGPVLLVVLYDGTRRAPASEHDALGFISLGCLMENMWLMAQSLGLGFHIISALSSNMTGDRVEGEARRILGFPDHLHIAFTCRVGYPRAKPGPYLRVRRDLGEFTHYNFYGRKGS
ncbi:MAG TPA: nitroreductase family protein [bacterium]|nr:nitroreductase family protein [bacterium]